MIFLNVQNEMYRVTKEMDYTEIELSNTKFVM